MADFRRHPEVISLARPSRRLALPEGVSLQVTPCIGPEGYVFFHRKAYVTWGPRTEVFVFDERAQTDFEHQLRSALERLQGREATQTYAAPPTVESPPVDTPADGTKPVRRIVVRDP